METNAALSAVPRQFVLDTARNAVGMVCLTALVHSGSCDS